MKRHSFTLVLFGATELSSELANGLYRALNGNIELGMCDGVLKLEVVRQGQTREKAIRDVKKRIDRARLGVKVLSIEPEGSSP